MCYNSSSPNIINCTITSNSAVDRGGGIRCEDNSSPIVGNSIFWENKVGGTPNEIYLEDVETSITITYSNINSSYITGPGTPSLGDSIINVNPMFVGSGDYHLQPASPCIDVGTSAGAPADDIDGDTRPQGAGYDMGADEYTDTAGCPHDGDVNQDGNVTPADALLTFQHYLGLTTLDECQQAHADVNNDGSVTPSDALCIFQKYLGLPSCLD